jgi:hypothetical protein
MPHNSPTGCQSALLVSAAQHHAIVAIEDTDAINAQCKIAARISAYVGKEGETPPRSGPAFLSEAGWV